MLNMNHQTVKSPLFPHGITFLTLDITLLMLNDVVEEKQVCKLMLNDGTQQCY